MNESGSYVLCWSYSTITLTVWSVYGVVRLMLNRLLLCSSEIAEACVCLALGSLTVREIRGDGLIPSNANRARYVIDNFSFDVFGRGVEHEGRC